MATTGTPYEYVGSVLSFGERSTIAAGVSRYLAAPGGTSMASELAVIAVQGGTVRNLRWSCAASTLTGAGNQITLYVDGKATKMASTWDGPITVGKPKSLPVSLPAMSTASVRIQLAAGTGTITRIRVSVELEMASPIPWLSHGVNMVYNDGGNVGIGTDKPAESLSVNGRIEAMVGGFRFPDGTVQTTAMVQVPIPPGSVIAYAGPAAPAGWLLCDGSNVSRAAYADLFAAIGTAHGAGDGSTTFALPDYRGRFLRGVTGFASVDVDAAGRLAMASGGNTGNAVGTVQRDQNHDHVHGLGSGSADSFTMVPGTDPQNTGRLAHFRPDPYNRGGIWASGAEGGSEARPVNAYVNYLIKP